MSNIMFFCIPAHGHTNPTINVVAELVKRGHRVRYYSFPDFREKIENAGAEYVSCEEYLPAAPEDLDKKLGKDFAALIEMVVDTTINLEPLMEEEMKSFQPDCIVSDSVCFWGKLFAKKYQIPFVCSTTTFAFNKYTAKLMKPGFMEIVRRFTGMPRINAKMQMLKDHGYPVDNFISIIQNDNDTDTIVYTSEKFQPMVETFSDRYKFVGPSVTGGYSRNKSKEKAQIYIALGTVLNNNIEFYKQCVEALKELECDVVISAGERTDISAIGLVPESFTILPRVNQLEVLANTDVFITHCGMNSVNESLYYGVPMVLFPQHSEEAAVANRVKELGAGIKLKKTNAKEIRNLVKEVLEDETFRKSAEEIGSNFRACGGASQAAEFISKIIKGNKN